MLNTPRTWQPAASTWPRNTASMRQRSTPMLLVLALAAPAHAFGSADASSNATSAVVATGRRLDVIDWPWKRGKGGGRRQRGGAGGSLNLTRANPDERTCYMLPPNEPVKRSGQIGDGTAFGDALQAIAMKPDVRRVLEIGTWYGGGSTVNLGRGIRDSWRKTLANSLSLSQGSDNCEEHPKDGGIERCCYSLVMTLEVFEPAWEHARRYLRDLPVHCIRGSTVRADEMLQARTRALACAMPRGESADSLPPAPTALLLTTPVLLRRAVARR